MFLARTLSGRLLLLTIIIVMMVEVLVFLPSVARFRQDFLLERLQMAQIASLALLAADDEMVEAALEEELWPMRASPPSFCGATAHGS